MKIKWIDSVDLEVVKSYDKELGTNSKPFYKRIERNQISEVKIISETKQYVDMEFISGDIAFAFAFGIDKDAFEEVLSPEHFNKITIGYVIQKYKRLETGVLVCIGQEFIASDEVTYETDDCEAVEIDKDKELYCPLEMVQPKPLPDDA